MSQPVAVPNGRSIVVPFQITILRCVPAFVSAAQVDSNAITPPSPLIVGPVFWHPLVVVICASVLVARS